MHKRVFNYRLSRARRIVENAFGILAWRFRIFLRPIELKVDTVDNVVLAACSLHNWLQSFSPTYITSSCVDDEDSRTGGLIPGQWRREIQPLLSVQRGCKSNNYQSTAEKVRQAYAEYFCNEGVINLQWAATGHTSYDYEIAFDGTSTTNNSDDNERADSDDND